MNNIISGSDTPRIKHFLDLAVKYRASDIHMVSNRPPVFRIQGRLVSIDLPPIEAEYLHDLLHEMIEPRQKHEFERNHELDFSYYGLEGYSFRVNMHKERGTIAATIRIMPGSLTSLMELGLPPATIGNLVLKRSGLILVVGRAGAGKTTTLTHMVEHINMHQQSKIITVEDPIEYLYASKKSLIVQREVGTDTHSFASGLKYALRQDPDVVVVGEMRDLESISMALTTAETGHLVLATMHAPDAIEAVNRIIDVYPGDKQNQIRVQMAENMLAIIGQQLLPKKDNSGRALASEIVITSLATRNMIRRNALAEIRSQMETGREGMYTLEQCLSSMVKRDIISSEVAQSHAKFPALLEL